MKAKWQKPKHEPSYESMIAFGCLCGARWQNEKLKGKSDETLIEERDEAFVAHVQEMEAKGY